MRSRRFLSARRGVCVLVALVALVVAGCSDDDLVIGATPTLTPTVTQTPTPSPTATPIDLTAFPAYADPGPYPVGCMTLSLSDRQVAGWYPAVPGSEAGAARLVYDQRDPLPEELSSRYPTDIDLSYTVDCYPGL